MREKLPTLGINIRFLGKVIHKGPSECWPWIGAVRGVARPYGMIWESNRNRAASQVAWEWLHGVVFPAGLEACHTCDNPRCVNPSHIFPGTRSDNMRDASAKGRMGTQMLNQTHCKHGHLFAGANLHVSPDGHRVCRACKRSATRRRRELIRALSEIVKGNP